MNVGSLYLRFPDFKQKALTFSYDDDVIFNERLKNLFDKYGFKSTFNLNGGLFAEQTNHRKMSAEDTVKLLADSNHEIALHGYRHLSLAETNRASAIMDVVQDRITLEKLFDRIVCGLAYGNGSFNDAVAQDLRVAGVKYARTIQSNHAFHVPTDWLQWHPTCHQYDKQIEELWENFIALEQSGTHRSEPYIFYVWGHSYEFNDKDDWGYIERLLEKFADKKDELYLATNGELYDYISGFDKLEMSIDRNIIYNPTVYDYYLQINFENYLIKSGQTLKLK